MIRFKLSNKTLVGRAIKVFSLVACIHLLSACSVVAEKTNILTDQQLVEYAAGATGHPIASLELLQRSASGTVTSYKVKAKNNVTFHCVLNGGNILSMGIVNPPVCNQFY
ncbi:hypothetical protein EIK76_10605 [Rheinheimera mesophila]|uniref:Lipoprotein n=1 Tax=Rheinheimera mesophila TaxID=1547515 RepID=A0A3P3QLM7_9GAMM|nr:hypothetical protein [Rheinheimera mesophila]KKL02492.1 hypothetical protein SD53_04460 [Rheinheimera mesophila]RRJ21319.1 hypothetical protein EIK76_10605 [Rheinheimera mesophila]